MNPAFENVTQMEDYARGEADHTANLRLHRHQERFPLQRARWWLRVVAMPDDVTKFYLDGKTARPISRAHAQDLIDVEWGRR